MRFEVRIDAKSYEVRNKLAELAQRARNLGPAFLKASVVVLARAQYNIRNKGGGSWAPTYEQSSGTALDRSGDLMRSLSIGGAGNVYEEIDHGVRIGTSVNVNGWNIGRMMQYGTGIWGRGTPIVPINSKFLVFEVNGQKMFMRSVKGSPPRPFLVIDDETAKQVVGIFQKYLIGGEA